MIRALRRRYGGIVPNDKMSTATKAMCTVALAGLLCGTSMVAGIAQQANAPNAVPLTSPPARQAQIAQTLDEWRNAMAAMPPPDAPPDTCFTATFPSIEWQQVPCGPAPDRLYSPGPSVPSLQVGNGAN
jgi:hypothetical protein